MFSKIHSCVKARYLVVPVEYAGRDSLTENTRAQPELDRLAVRRVIDLRIYVRVKPIRLRPRNIPRGGRFLFDEADLRDRFRAFISILPRHRQTQRSAILRGQNFT